MAALPPLPRAEETEIGGTGWTGEVDVAGTDRRSPYSLLVPAATIVVFTLGAWGFALVDSGSWLDHGYRSLQLFVIEAGDGFPDPIPWQLEVTRWVAPAITLLSTALAVAVLSRGRLDAWRARRMRGHVIVAGLGRRETEAALVLRRGGHDVVVISRHPPAGGVRRCRRAGIAVVEGDPRDPLALEAGGLGRASDLIVLDPELETSGRVALAAVGLAAARSEWPLVVHVEMADPALVGLLKALKISEHHAAGWRVEELDLAGAGASIMVDAVAPWADGSALAEVLVAGESTLAAAVVSELRRRWRLSGGAPDALSVVRTGSGSALSVGAVPSSVYVCADDEPEALTTALAVLRDFPGVPVAVHLEHTASFGTLLMQDAHDLHVVSLDTQVLTPAVLLDTTVERIARALHGAYRRQAEATSPSALPWAELAESLRASNRAQAEHVCDKLRVMRRVLLPDDGQPTDRFTEDEIQELGRLEHDRWVAERRAAGWTPGPRDTHARTTPYLVPWEELTEEVREIDRQFVRALPDVLADSGLVIRRSGASSVQPSADRPVRSGS
ncbi:hypothetical protein GA707_13425 [Nostocoides sp. F2B08]|uniref:RyR domain-containing protein n=1 Tax=Nostocoides sp. F2B08 TaxID=2653936 RepID=UPI001262AFF9|nr:RyR domain-containing protein [Tetrasphaera sp. F2B08]KAB7743602.1 hypothetical protein GA707_13425 [Tetrasphaera sp. F2B08]